MSLNPLAPAFHSHYQCCSDPPISLCNSTTMSLLLAHLFCGTPQEIISSHAPSISQPITDGTFILPPIQPTNQSKQDSTTKSIYSTTSWILISFVLTSPTSSELSTSYSQNYPTVQPTLEGRTPQPTDITTQCPLTTKWLCLNAPFVLLQQGYCR